MTETLFLVGDVREKLKEIPDNSVHCVITSSPYYQLRSYGTAPQVWLSDTPCEGEHDWVTEKRYWDNRHAAAVAQGLEGNSAIGGNAMPERRLEHAFCAKCGSWKGELGSEPEPSLFIRHLVEIFREVKRALHYSGTVFLNLGDSYVSSPAGNKVPSGMSQATGKRLGKLEEYNPGEKQGFGLKRKNLLMIPFRVAIAMQDDGWVLRSVIPWIKKSCMPESCEDRPSTATEYVFMFAKSEQYFYDIGAVRIKQKQSTVDRSKYSISGFEKQKNCNDAVNYINPRTEEETRQKCLEGIGRNRRNSDWFLESFSGLYEEDNEPLAFLVNSEVYHECHFAPWPKKLVEPMVHSGSGFYGCCSKCLSPWERIVEVTSGQTGSRHNNENDDIDGQSEVKLSPFYNRKTTGWQPTCKCDTNERIPCTVLDPFAGTGTTGLVAAYLGRNSILIELQKNYIPLIEKRLSEVALTNRIEVVYNAL